MKQLFASFIVMCMTQLSAIAQLTTVPDGGNKKAMVAERVGLTDVTINYNRPAVKGREGKIWGALVPYGFTDLGFGTSKAAPWRAGANENTTIEFSTDVKVENKPLAAGRYGFSVAVGKDESTLIFSKNSSAWGSFFYEPKEDALRVTVKQQPMDKLTERLTYHFIDQTENAAVIALDWEKLRIPFKVEAEVDKYQIQSFRNELSSNRGFDWKAWAQAANWSADHNTNLEEGLQWADYSISGPFVGERNFQTLSAKSRILKLMNKTAEADALMKEAMLLGNMTEVHGYARQLLTAKKQKEAAEAFRANYKKYPNTFTTNMGLVRAFSSEGNFKEALKYANIALPQAPDPNNKSNVEGMIQKLNEGKDVN
jgi:hypothetical protein